MRYGNNIITNAWRIIYSFTASDMNDQFSHIGWKTRLYRLRRDCDVSPPIMPNAIPKPTSPAAASMPGVD